MSLFEFDFSSRGSTDGFALRVTEGIFRGVTAEELLRRLDAIEAEKGIRPNLRIVRQMIEGGSLARMSDVEFRDLVRKCGIGEIYLTIEKPDRENDDRGVSGVFE